MVVQEAVHRDGVIRAPLSDLPELTALLKDASPIESAGACRSFELTWNRYVAYLVTEECVGSCGAPDGETFSGKLFRVYTKSRFLEHLARDTGGHFEATQHYKLMCLNHLIDVAAYTPPQVRVIGPTSSGEIRIQ
jgi:hypothetical protein